MHNPPIVFAVPGDLHLTEAGLDNHRAALWMTDEVNELVRPDFVQFIGDNVQHATDDQFRLFKEVCGRLRVPFEVLVGDHDVYEDSAAERFRRYVGQTYGASSLAGFRFVRLNTLEHQPLGFSDDQIIWFRNEVVSAAERDEPVIVFQHHYPFKVYEQFAGPGVAAWREIVQTRSIAAIFTGHTHYGQIANDGRNISITTRSIGDPEGGPPGFTLACLCGDDLAATYRSLDQRGPLVLITHPRNLLLATGPRHIVSGDDSMRVRVWSRSPIKQAQGRLDGGDWFGLERVAADEWNCGLSRDRLSKGEHRLETRIRDEAGDFGSDAITFFFDATGRYTPTPRTEPTVKSTAFC
ncbi:MAG TPA: metallophosphoesterase [Pirellulales bacterium]|nr:metallophosphoesterase [Pirellulales bacterium]